MVRRGVALVKKKDSKWRDVWIDSNGEETSPPPNEQPTKEKCAARLSNSDLPKYNPLIRYRSHAQAAPKAL